MQPHDFGNRQSLLTIDPPTPGERPDMRHEPSNHPSQNRLPVMHFDDKSNPTDGHCVNSAPFDFTFVVDL